MVLVELPKYLEPSYKSRFEMELMDQGLSRRDTKQLWLSLLNSGSIHGWRHGLLKTYGGGLKISMSEALRSHLKKFREEVMCVRQRVLEDERWALRYQVLVNPGGRRKALGKERACRRLWNAALTTVEARVIRDLEKLVDGGAAGGSAKVVMPSYDGLLIKHTAGGFDIEKLQHAWADVCRTEYAYHFPVEAKNLEDDLPGWVRRLTALAQ